MGKLSWEEMDELRKSVYIQNEKLEETARETAQARKDEMNRIRREVKSNKYQDFANQFGGMSCEWESSYHKKKLDWWHESHITILELLEEEKDPENRIPLIKEEMAQIQDALLGPEIFKR